MIVTVTANPLLDHLAEGAPAPGGIRRVDAFVPTAGGKGLNVARVLARHGHRVLACGFAGGRSGEHLAELVAADGVEPAFTAVAAATRVGFQLIDGASVSAVMARGFPVTASECGSLLSRVRSLLGAARLVLIGGSTCHSAADGLYRQLADACAHAGVPCWIDAYGPAMAAALAGAHPPALGKPNREEYAALGEKTWLACRELHVTDGAEPVRVLHPEGRLRVTPPRVRERNATGSGDCYLAGLAHARLAGMPLEQQCRYAAAAGAANSARADVAAIAPEDIAALLDQVAVEAEP